MIWAVMVWTLTGKSLFIDDYMNMSIREPSTYSPQIFGPLIQGFREAMTAAGGSAKLLSAAVWETGAEPPQTGSPYYGLNLQGLASNGPMLDWINVMSKDDDRSRFARITKLTLRL